MSQSGSDKSVLIMNVNAMLHTKEKIHKEVRVYSNDLLDAKTKMGIIKDNIRNGPGLSVGDVFYPMSSIKYIRFDPPYWKVTG